MKCSFCGKSDEQVRKLVAGPHVFICDECITACVDILASDARFSVTPTDVERVETLAAKLPDGTRPCGLCGADTPATKLLPVDGREPICGTCADAIEDALARGEPGPDGSA